MLAANYVSRSDIARYFDDLVDWEWEAPASFEDFVDYVYAGHGADVLESLLDSQHTVASAIYTDGFISDYLILCGQNPADYGITIDEVI